MSFFKNFTKKIKIVTHSGKFHPDDVFAVATLELWLNLCNKKWELIRSRDPSILKSADFIVDVGGEYNEDNNHFDHHQIGGAGNRKNGVSYASFGLVWKKFGGKVSDNNSQIAKIIDKKLVQSIDALDNGEGSLKSILSDALPYTIGHFIRLFNPTWLDKNKSNDVFQLAVEFAKIVLQTEISVVKAEVLGYKKLDDLYSKTKDKRYLIIDKNYFWNDYIQKYPEILFVIEPAKESVNWEIEAVKKNETGFENKLDLPMEWAGKKGADLAKITGVEDAVFCHNKRFLVVVGSLAGAKKMVKLALENK